MLAARRSPMARSRSYGLVCCLLMGWSGRTTLPLEVDAANTNDAAPGAKDGAAGGAGSDDTSDDRCVPDIYEGKALPVDLYLVLDRSHTARCPLRERCASDGGVSP